MSNILIVAPHPDDEVLGCGGVMKKYADAGHNVYVLVVTRGTPKLYVEDRITNVRNEARQAHKILGVTETYFFDFEGDLYGKHLKIEMLTRIRDEKKFDSIDALKIALKQDRAFSMQYIKDNHAE